MTLIKFYNDGEELFNRQDDEKSLAVWRILRDGPFKATAGGFLGTDMSFTIVGSPNEDFPGPEWEYGRAQYSSGWGLLIHDLCSHPAASLSFTRAQRAPWGRLGFFVWGAQIESTETGRATWMMEDDDIIFYLEHYEAAEESMFHLVQAKTMGGSIRLIRN